MRATGLRTMLAGVLAVGLALGLLPGTPSARGEPAGGAGAPAPSPGGSVPAGPPVTVTLITGDRVLVRSQDGEMVPHVEPAPGREHVRFSARRVGEQLLVVPSDAVALLGEGRLDPRLFDVAGLVGFGYDDAHRDDLPLILQGAATAADDDPPSTRAASAGGEPVPLPAADALALSQPKDRTGELWTEIVGDPASSADATAATLNAGVGKIWLDGLRQPTLDVSVRQIGAPDAWEAGYTGAGVDVAVLDTGIDGTHPDLAGRIADTRNFTEDPDAADAVGHGTHVASTIVGSGAASGGQYRGVAPDAQLLVGKVCEESGCAESWIVAGMQWAAEAGADVVNMSLGGSDTPEVDPLEQAVETLSAETGALFVVAAGNDGPVTATLSSPASADAALAVGAVDDDDQLAEFSSRGPRIDDAGLKPEITAPGVGIVAARAAGTEPSEPVGEHYASEEGTSMATPHVAGAAALLAQQHPDWTGEQLKAVLVGAAHRVEGPGPYEQGAGRVDVARAVDQQLHARPAAVSLGRQAWPHDDDVPVTSSITYRNPGPEPVTLTLTLTTAGPDGGPAPAGMFRLGQDAVTVPAGGEAAVPVTADTSVSSPDGSFGGWVVATAPDGAVVTTPVGVDKEVESYDVTLVHTDREGAPGQAYGTLALEGQRRFFDYYDPDGAVTMRVPRGRYLMDSLVLTPRGETEDLSWLVQPRLEVTGDVTLELDARRARPFELSFDRPDVVFDDAALTFVRTDEAWEYLSFMFWRGTADGVTSLHLGPAVGDDEMITQFASQLDVPTSAPAGGGGSPGAWRGTPRVYNLMWAERGRMMSGLTRSVRDRDLAQVRADYHATREGGEAVVWAMGQHEGGMALAMGMQVPLPRRQVELYNTDGGVRWCGEVWEVVPDPDDPEAPPVPISGVSGDHRLRAGRTTSVRWNTAVFRPTPSSIEACGLAWGSGRVGDTVTVSMPLSSDAEGHPGWAVGTGRTTLLRDGEVVGETDTPGFGEFEVPAEAGTYRLETEQVRDHPDGLSSRVTAAWTFESAHVDGDETEELPLLGLRFAPRLDDHNRAPAGERFAIPLRVDARGDAARLARRPTVEVSYDDGATWTAARVRRDGRGRYTAVVQHPEGAGFVSLRATATDRDGNQVEHTIIHAYRLA